jgi:hypothetical protein
MLSDFPPDTGVFGVAGFIVDDVLLAILTAEEIQTMKPYCPVHSSSRDSRVEEQSNLREGGVADWPRGLPNGAYRDRVVGVPEARMRQLKDWEKELMVTRTIQHRAAQQTSNL